MWNMESLWFYMDMTLVIICFWWYSFLNSYFGWCNVFIFLLIFLDQLGIYFEKQLSIINTIGVCTNIMINIFIFCFGMFVWSDIIFDIMSTSSR